jgi:hypothetical protein
VSSAAFAGNKPKKQQFLPELKNPQTHLLTLQNKLRY